MTKATVKKALSFALAVVTVALIAMNAAFVTNAAATSFDGTLTRIHPTTSSDSALPARTMTSATLKTILEIFKNYPSPITPTCYARPA